MKFRSPLELGLPFSFPGMRLVSWVALKFMGVSLKDARSKVNKLTGRGSEVLKGEIPLNDDAKALLDRAWKEAGKLSHPYIGTEHLLLGLVKQEPSIIGHTDIALKVLKQLGLGCNESTKSCIALARRITELVRNLERLFARRKLSLAKLLCHGFFLRLIQPLAGKEVIV